MIMKQSFLKKISRRKNTDRLVLVLSIIIGAVLAISAWGKLFYPAQYVKTLDHWASGIEALLLVMIFLFRKHWQLWLSAAVLFASWCGYALFWYCLKLPCSCMGAMLTIPTVFSIVLDVLFFGSSLFAAYLLGAKRNWLYATVFLGLVVGLGGYFFASWIYQTSVVRL